MNGACLNIHIHIIIIVFVYIFVYHFIVVILLSCLSLSGCVFVCVLSMFLNGKPLNRHLSICLYVVTCATEGPIPYTIHCVM